MPPPGTSVSQQERSVGVHKMGCRRYWRVNNTGTQEEMLFLQSEYESNATMCEALAFIDAFEAQESASTSGDSSPGRLQKTKKKRSHRDRVKSELQRLRNDASALEVTLTRLKQSLRYSVRGSDPRSQRWRPIAAQLEVQSPGTVTERSDDPRVAAWMEIAIDEYRRRRQSEATNRQLKDLLAKHLKVTRASEAALAVKLTEVVRFAVYHHCVMRLLAYCRLC